MLKFLNHLCERGVKAVAKGTLVDSLKRGSLTKAVLTEFKVSQTSFPISLDMISVELTNECNQKCEFCPTGIETNPRPKGKMPFEIFKTVVDQITSSTEIQMAGYGEPFLNNQLEIFLDYAGTRKIKNLDIYSNFTALKEDRIRRLFNYPFRNLVISLDGMDRHTFQVYKGCDQFDRAFENIKILADEKRKRETVKQKIYVQMVVTKKNVEQLPRFQKEIKNLGLIPNLKTLNTHITKATPEKIDEFEVPEFSRYEKRQDYLRNCQWVWGGAIVYWNGDISICCQDSLGSSIYGNVTKRTMPELLNQERASFRRRYFSDPAKIDICRSCHRA